MEYLMTYGWSILIISVVIGAMYQIGVFSSVSLSPRAIPGSCRVIRTGGITNIEGSCGGQIPQFVGIFNGQGSQVSTTSSATLKPKSITISVWVDITSFPASGTEMHFVDNYASSTGFVYDVYGSDGAYFFFDTPTRYSANFGISAAGWNTGTWVNYVATYSQTTGVITLYLNGKQQNTGNAPPGQAITYSSSTLIIGGASNTAYNGLMSNVQIYNTTFDAGQVQTLYAEGIGGEPVSAQYLVGWWPLDGNFNDYSGNNNNGSPTAITFTSQYGK